MSSVCSTAPPSVLLGFMTTVWVSPFNVTWRVAISFPFSLFVAIHVEGFTSR